MAFQEFDETLLREFNLKYNWLSKTESLVWEIAVETVITSKEAIKSLIFFIAYFLKYFTNGIPSASIGKSSF